MLSPSLQLAQMNQQSPGPLSQLSGNIVGLIQQQQQKNALAAQDEALSGAWNTFVQDPSATNQESFLSLVPTERLTSANKMIDNYYMQTDTKADKVRTNSLQTYVSIIGNIENGNTDAALRAANNKMEAALASDDLKTAAEFKRIIGGIEAGNGNTVAKVLAKEQMYDEAGRNAMKALSDQSAAIQAGEAHDVEMFETIRKLPGVSSSEKGILTAMADNLGKNELADLIAFMGSPTQGTEGLTADQISKWENTLYNTMRTVTTPLRDAQASYDKIVTTSNIYDELAGIDKDTEEYKSAVGIADVALMNSFQRIIDEGATVREGDVALLQKSGSSIDQVLTWVKSFSTGDKLSTPQRKAILDVSQRMLGEVKAESVDQQRTLHSRAYDKGYTMNNIADMNEMQAFMYENAERISGRPLSKTESFKLLNNKGLSKEDKIYLYEKHPLLWEAWIDMQ